MDIRPTALLAFVLQVIPVLFPVAGIDNKKEFVFHKTVQVSIIDDAARFIGNHRVLSEPHVEACCIIGQNVLEKSQGEEDTVDEAPKSQ